MDSESVGDNFTYINIYLPDDYASPPIYSYLYIYSEDNITKDSFHDWWENVETFGSSISDRGIMTNSSYFQFSSTITKDYTNTSGTYNLVTNSYALLYAKDMIYGLRYFEWNPESKDTVPTLKNLWYVINTVGHDEYILYSFNFYLINLGSKTGFEQCECGISGGGSSLNIKDSHGVYGETRSGSWYKPYGTGFDMRWYIIYHANVSTQYQLRYTTSESVVNSMISAVDSPTISVPNYTARNYGYLFCNFSTNSTYTYLTQNAPTNNTYWFWVC